MVASWLGLATGACGSSAASPSPSTTLDSPATVQTAAGVGAGGSRVAAAPSGGTPANVPSVGGSAGRPVVGAGVAGAGLTVAGSSGTLSTSSGSAGVGGGDTAPVAGSLAAGSGGGNGGAASPEVACNPSDKKADPKPFPVSSVSGGSNTAPIAPAKGPLPPMIEEDPGLTGYTIFRPEQLAGAKYPIVVWANGGCSLNGTLFSRFLLEFASHGFVIVAYGKPNGSGMSELTTNGVPQTKALDWIVAENERPCSQYYHKLDVTKTAAMGQSCGGLMTLGAAGDPRLTTVVIWNSGLLEGDDKIYAALHAPMAYFIGGPDDVAYPNAETDFTAIKDVPVFNANLPVGHLATYSQDNGGEFAQIGIAWLKWQLLGDTSASAGGLFSGPSCGLCTNSKWTVKKKNMD